MKQQIKVGLVQFQYAQNYPMTLTAKIGEETLKWNTHFAPPSTLASLYGCTEPMTKEKILSAMGFTDRYNDCEEIRKLKLLHTTGIFEIDLADAFNEACGEYLIYQRNRVEAEYKRNVADVTKKHYTLKSIKCLIGGGVFELTPFEKCVMNDQVNQPQLKSPTVNGASVVVYVNSDGIIEVQSNYRTESRCTKIETAARRAKELYETLVNQQKQLETIKKMEEAKKTALQTIFDEIGVESKNEQEYHAGNHNGPRRYRSNGYYTDRQIAKAAGTIMSLKPASENTYHLTLGPLSKTQVQSIVKMLEASAREDAAQVC